MKLKWKIVIILSAVLLFTISFTNLYFYRNIKDLVNSETSEELSNYSTLGLCLLDSNYPGDWRLDGDTLYKGETVVNEDYKLVDEMTKDTGIIATIFAMDTRISTTVKNDDGKRMVDTKASEQVVQKVLKEGKEYQGIANVAGRKASTFYTPLKDKAGNTIGMWFVGIYSDEVNAKIKGSILSSLGFVIILSMIGVIISYLIGKAISKGFYKIKNDLEQFEKGDFRIEIGAKAELRKDELGDIAKSFHKMKNQISNIIISIKDETARIETSSTTLADAANNVYDNIEDISATTEELSAGMEETAASAEEMNATMAEIETEIQNVAEMANHGIAVASEIKSRAESLKSTAFLSQENAVTIYGNVNTKLRQAIEKASAIEEIRSLSKAIMDINAQTNLLALNASIESARAGEAGKGFAVVANEIGVLAKNSKNAVSKIEEITNEVANVLESMIDASKYLLEFVDSKVIKDYEVLVDTSNQYQNDANTVNSMVNDIKNFTTHLSESIQYIRQAIDEVTMATNEASRGSVEIADKTNSIFHKTDEVLELSNTNKEVAVKLHQMVEYFQV